MTHGNAHRNHLAKAGVHRVRVKGYGGRYWLFTFSERWGPSLCDAWGEPLASQAPLADEEHPFWDAFEAWFAARQALRGEVDG